MTDVISPQVLVTVYCLLAFVAALGGGWIPTLFGLTHSRLQIAISMVAGLMLGLAILHLLPHAAHELGSVDRSVAWMLAGFVVMFLMQRFLPFHQHDVPEAPGSASVSGGCGHHHGHAHGATAAHDHSHDHDHAPAQAGHATEGAHASAPPVPALDWMGVALGLSFHSIFDGLALAAAVAAESRGHGVALGLGTALAVILHKPFSAMAITTLMAASHTPRRWHHWINVAFALVTPLGALLFYLGAGPALASQTALLGSALAFCAGTFLCIACADLLPELQFHSHDRVKLSLALVLGLGIAVLIGRLGHGHDHPPEGSPVPVEEGDHHGHDHAHPHP